MKAKHRSMRCITTSTIGRYSHPLPPGTLYFHAEYRQAQPNHGWTNKWTSNGESFGNDKVNLDGKDNYVGWTATGHGQYVGVTMSVLQNQDNWWGEGDDMFFVDGAKLPSIAGTGSEDYFLGAWDFGGKPFSYQLYGAPVVGKELAGSRSSVYRFHLDSPIPFSKSFKATIEHGHANAPLRQLLFRCLLVSGGAACSVSSIAAGRRQNSALADQSAVPEMPLLLRAQKVTFAQNLNRAAN